MTDGKRLMPELADISEEEGERLTRLLERNADAEVDAIRDVLERTCASHRAAALVWAVGRLEHEGVIDGDEFDTLLRVLRVSRKHSLIVTTDRGGSN